MYVPLGVLAWWTCLLVLGVMAVRSPTLLPAWIGLLAGPLVLMAIKKRSVQLAAFSLLAWTLDTAGFVRGIVSRPADPTAPIASRTLGSRVPERGPSSATQRPCLTGE
jgi:hypothetical protein